MSSPIAPLAVLAAPMRAQRLMQPGRHRSRRTISARRGGVNWKIGKLTRNQSVAGSAEPAADVQPPVTLMWRLTLGRLCRRSMMKSWPFGFSPIARSIAASSSSLSADARSGLRKIGGVLVAEAGVQRAGAGDPHPVAGLAEIMGHRRDEAELAAGLARRARSARGRRCRRRGRSMCIAWQAARAAATAAHIGRCGLRRCRPSASPRSASAPCRWPCAHCISAGISSSFMFFSATALILTRKTGGARRLDAGQHLVEIAPAGDGAEFRRHRACPARR